jgi:hypothetical protein
MTITNDVREQDLDILLKTTSVLAHKDFIDVNDFRRLFEIPVNMVKQKKMQELAMRQKSFQ